MLLFLQKHPLIDLERLFNDFNKFADLVVSLAIFFLHLFHDFKRPVFLAEHPVVSFSVDPLDLEEVVCSSGTLNVKADHALAVLALDARAAILAATDNALKAEPLSVDLRHPDRCLWCHDRPWNPHCAAQMNPLI